MIMIRRGIANDYDREGDYDDDKDVGEVKEKRLPINNKQSH